MARIYPCLERHPAKFKHHFLRFTRGIATGVYCPLTKNAASRCWKHLQAADLQTGVISLGLWLIVSAQAIGHVLQNLLTVVQRLTDLEKRLRQLEQPPKP
jgi:hypothetical protein